MVDVRDVYCFFFVILVVQHLRVCLLFSDLSFFNVFPCSNDLL